MKESVKNCYPTVLGQLLSKTYEVKIFGINGSTSLKNGDRPYWKLKVFRTATIFTPQIVNIKLGTYDPKTQNWGKVGGESGADTHTMISHFWQLPSQSQVFFCLPAPVYQIRWGINDNRLEKSGVIPVVKKAAKYMKRKIIDLYKALSGKTEMFPYKIHPNSGGVGVMVQTIRTGLTKQPKN